MKLERYDPGTPPTQVFTDNLCKAYRAYKPFKDSGFCARNQTHYLRSRTERYLDRVNQ
jgi:hypothetical protein